jgi:hypothetical protein
MIQGHKPDWRPLLEVAGDEVTGGFMWMYDVRLASGRYLQAYKHFTPGGTFSSTPAATRSHIWVTNATPPSP